MITFASFTVTKLLSKPKILLFLSSSKPRDSAISKGIMVVSGPESRMPKVSSLLPFQLNLKGTRGLRTLLPSSSLHALYLKKNDVLQDGEN